MVRMFNEMSLKELVNNEAREGRVVAMFELHWKISDFCGIKASEDAAKILAYSAAEKKMISIHYDSCSFNSCQN